MSENSVEKADRILRQLHSDAIGFEHETEQEQEFRTGLGGVNVESYNFRVRCLLESQIEGLQRLLGELPQEEESSLEVEETV